ncbi:MAG: hypothetical protein MUE85_24465 [Microscillaceae bacterium]|jgi:hypothetical protein|nr:hypothetical protein [Microscillaceae bacterium]
MLRVFIILLSGLTWLPNSIWAMSDTTFRLKNQRLLPDIEASAAGREAERLLPNVGNGLPSYSSLPQTASQNLSKKYLQKYAPQSIPQNKKFSPKSLAKPQFKNQHAQIKPPKNQKKSGFWRFVNKLIDLDWLMVGIAVAIGVLIIVGLYILLRGNVLTLLEMILFALGFGGAVFFYWLANSENTAGEALYDYFVRYGFFSLPGIFAIIAGFVGLFGGGGSFGTFLLIGLILGGISFLLSLLFKKSILHRR